MWKKTVATFSETSDVLWQISVLAPENQYISWQIWNIMGSESTKIAREHIKMV
jgi:hypothetical protein